MLIRPILCSIFLAPIISPQVALPFAAVPSAAAPVRARQTGDCGTWEDCRDRALAAREAGDFERFHDLAWRAVQKGPRNDADLMTMLARAQSLSGRPGDALVMLQRLAAMGVVTDAAESDDFRRVRALPGWPDLQARMADAAAARAAAPATGAEPAASSPAARSRPEPEVRAPAASRPESKPEPAKPAPPAAAPTVPPADPEPAGKAVEAGAAGAGVDDAVRFTTIPFEPAGLAYDVVSNRFIIGDRRDRKLHVIGERSQRIATLAGEESAGFGEVEAIAIDPREGDLWVASTSDGDAPPKLHKLQLISGRVLSTAVLPDDAAEARLRDVAVNAEGVVFALDASGGRLFRLQPGSQEVERISTPDLPQAVSLAIAGAAIYLAGPEGLLRVVPSEGSVAPVKASDPIDLTGLAGIRWHRDSLVGVQRSAGDLYRIVRIRLDGAGRRATRLQVLEQDVALVSPSSIAVMDDALFYLARNRGYSATGGMDVTIRRVTLPR